MRKKRGGSRGETLMETVVSFAVLLTMLAMLATVMQGAARMNQFAAQRAAILEADCTRVEQNTGRYDETGGAVSDTLTLTPTTETDPFGTHISIQLDVRRCEILCYFSTVLTGGG